MIRISPSVCASLSGSTHDFKGCHSKYLLSNYTLAHGFANLKFQILSWEKFGFVEPRVHVVLGQAGPCGESAHGVTVRVGVPYGHNMAEKDFEGAFWVQAYFFRK